MILMYHHVCPSAEVPVAAHSAQEGWTYNIEPSAFEQQLETLRGRGWRFVSLADYVQHCHADRLRWGTATITFDDGWLDNFEHAYPVLQSLGVPACWFVVSGDWTAARTTRRMGDAHLRELVAGGMTIGAHSKSHPDLSRLDERELKAEVGGCKDDLEQRLGASVDFFAYPGGRFNRRVVEATRTAGYQAACSIIGGGRNGRESLYWLYRDTLSQRTDTLRDRAFLNRVARKLLQLRARRRLQRMLAS